VKFLTAFTRLSIISVGKARHTSEVRQLEVTRKTEYAISALIELAKHPGKYVSSKTIAEKQDIPKNFLPQIIALLGSHGWVAGLRGPGGGVRLEADPATIAVKDVIELIEGEIAVARCLSDKVVCSKEGECPLQPVWREAQTAFLTVLQRFTIADLVENTP